MKNTIKAFLSSLILILTSCITIGGNKEIVPAKNISYQNPGASFELKKDRPGDKSWQSTRTKNSITFFSDCSENADPSLDQLQNDVVSGFEDTKLSESETISYNQRQARKFVLFGSLDGISVQIQGIVFKKNGCSYTLIYGGKKVSFNSELPIFNDFINGFQVP